jgi:hypothetical protein
MPGYCLSCKQNYPKLDEQEEFTSINGKKMIRGVCPHCQKSSTSFLKGKKSEGGEVKEDEHGK